MAECPQCRGTGVVPAGSPGDNSWRTCPRCGGTGRIRGRALRRLAAALAIAATVSAILTAVIPTSAVAQCVGACREDMEDQMRQREQRQNAPTYRQPQSSYPVNHIGVQNFSFYPVEVTVAYVPQGTISYVVDGSWRFEAQQKGALTTGSGNYVLHNPAYPIYAYIKCDNGHVVRDVNHSRRKFYINQTLHEFDRWRLIGWQGGSWVQLVTRCKPR